MTFRIQFCFSLQYAFDGSEELEDQRVILACADNLEQAKSAAMEFFRKGLYGEEKGNRMVFIRSLDSAKAVVGIPSDMEKAVDYYKSQATSDPFPRRLKPRYVPARVRLLRTIYLKDEAAMPGDYDCVCNSLGDVSIIIADKEIALLIYDFEVLAWGENTNELDKNE